MAIQKINLGTEPHGVGGDSYRTANEKINSNFEEVGKDIKGVLDIVKTGDFSKTAYDIAVKNGFVGSEKEWLTSLKGEQGPEARSAYDIAVSNGFKGDEKEWLSYVLENTEVVSNIHTDARSLSEFIYKPADFMVERRLAPKAHTLQYYLDFLDSTRDEVIDFSTELNQMTETMLNKALEEKAVPEGLVADTFVTLTPYTADGVARTLRSKNMEQVSVLDFGAKGDGINDDYQSIQKAIKYGVSRGVNIYIPSGTYVLSETLEVRDANNIHVIAESNAIFRATGSQTPRPIYDKKEGFPLSQIFIAFEGCSNCKMVGGFFDGSAGAWGAGLKAPSYPSIAVMLRNCEQSFIEHGYFYSIGDGSKNTSPEVPSRPKRDIGAFITQSKNCGIRYCKAYRVGYEGFSCRIAVDGIDFTGNSQDDNDGYSAHMMQPTNDYGGVFPLDEDNYARNIKIINNVGIGQFSDITVHAKNVIVTGNTLIDVTGSPIDVRAFSANVTIIGNTIACSDGKPKGFAAIHLDFSVPDCYVAGNIIRNYEKEYNGSDAMRSHFYGNNILTNVDDADNSRVRLGKAAGHNTKATLDGGISKNFVAVGIDAGRTYTGENQIAIGQLAAAGGSGLHSVSIGSQAGRDSDLTESIAIGMEAGKGVKGLTGWTAIGRKATPTASNQFKIGDRQHIEISSIPSPASPPTSSIRLYAYNNSGTMELRVKFPDGSTKTIAADKSAVVAAEGATV